MFRADCPSARAGHPSPQVLSFLGTQVLYLVNLSTQALNWVRNWACNLNFFGARPALRVSTREDYTVGIVRAVPLHDAPPCVDPEHLGDEHRAAKVAVAPKVPVAVCARFADAADAVVSQAVGQWVALGVAWKRFGSIHSFNFLLQ